MKRRFNESFLGAVHYCAITPKLVCEQFGRARREKKNYEESFLFLCVVGKRKRCLSLPQHITNSIYTRRIFRTQSGSRSPSWFPILLLFVNLYIYGHLCVLRVIIHFAFIRLCIVISSSGKHFFIFLASTLFSCCQLTFFCFVFFRDVNQSG